MRKHTQIRPIERTDPAAPAEAEPSTWIPPKGAAGMLGKPDPVLSEVPSTYAEMAAGDDFAGGRWRDDVGPRMVGVPKYPKGPEWTQALGATGKEAPLGVNVNWLPDVSGISGRDPKAWPKATDAAPTAEAIAAAAARLRRRM